MATKPKKELLRGEKNARYVDVNEEREQLRKSKELDIYYSKKRQLEEQARFDAAKRKEKTFEILITSPEQSEKAKILDKLFKNFAKKILGILKVTTQDTKLVKNEIAARALSVFGITKKAEKTKAKAIEYLTINLNDGTRMIYVDDPNGPDLVMYDSININAVEAARHIAMFMSQEKHEDILVLPIQALMPNLALTAHNEVNNTQNQQIPRLIPTLTISEEVSSSLDFRVNNFQENQDKSSQHTPSPNSQITPAMGTPSPAPSWTTDKSDQELKEKLQQDAIKKGIITELQSIFNESNEIRAQSHKVFNDNMAIEKKQVNADTKEFKKEESETLKALNKMMDPTSIELVLVPTKADKSDK